VVQAVWALLSLLVGMVLGLGTPNTVTLAEAEPVVEERDEVDVIWEPMSASQELPPWRRE